MCVLLSLLTLSGYTQVSSAKSLKLLMEQWTSYKNQCSQSIVATPPATGLVCNRTFDQYACWPDGLPGTTVNVSCPWYLPWYRKGVCLLCSGDGRWAPKNTSECEQDDPGQVREVCVCACVCVYVVWCWCVTVAGCRIAMVMMQYSVIANNYLAEGCVYVCFISLSFCLFSRSLSQMNFFIFIRIIKILMSKLKAHQMRYTDYKFRLAKSTLTLIPLLGIHAILFTLVIDESVPKGSKMRLIRLFYDLLFNSFQGLLVAILYCFVNKEVQSEMLKKWKRWKLGKDIEEEYRHTYSHAPHVKSGSIVTGNLAGSSRLVGSCHNRTDKTKTQPSLQCPSTPHGGTNNCSTLMEDICLEERAQSYTRPEEGAESNF
uniref:Glucagon receptor b n=1 Tax=Oncorhynchus kisutch TaxID=8019 RepID=A0A8C7JWB9_ONCKI